MSCMLRACCVSAVHAGRPPCEFPQPRLRLDFSSVHMSPPLRLLLAGLLEPMAEERLTAGEALALLQVALVLFGLGTGLAHAACNALGGAQNVL